MTSYWISQKKEFFNQITSIKSSDNFTTPSGRYYVALSMNIMNK